MMDRRRRAAGGGGGGGDESDIGTRLARAEAAIVHLTARIESIAGTCSSTQATIRKIGEKDGVTEGTA